MHKMRFLVAACMAACALSAAAQTTVTTTNGDTEGTGPTFNGLSAEIENLLLPQKGNLEMSTIRAAAQSISGPNTFPSTGSVGIGTASPASLLQLQSNFAYESINSTSTSGWNTSGVGLLANGGGIVDSAGDSYYVLLNYNGVPMAGELATAPNIPLYLGTNETVRLTILGNGAVGIGTPNPTYTLDVAGQVNSSGGYCIGSNCISSWPTIGANTWSAPQTFALSTTFPGNGIWNASGNVGIGTTGPLDALHVASDVNILNSSWLSTAQLYLSGKTDVNQHLALGYDTTNNVGVIQAADNGVADKPLLLNPGGGAVGIGTTAPGATLEVNGTTKIDGALTIGGAGIYFPGSSTPQAQPYTGITCGDYAESVDVAGDRKNYEPGDLLVIGAESGSDVLKSAEPYSTLVGGIYSTKPGTVGRRQTTDYKSSKTEVPMAMVGIVPAKVSAENGPIKRGDLLVTSSTPGYAMKGTDRSRMLGAVVGKALGNLDSGTGMIEVLVTLQ